jgi:hypothetical protein
MSPSRIVYLSIFTLCFFTFSIWIQYRSILFPIGIFKPAVFLISIILILKQFKRFTIELLFAFLAALFLVLSSRFTFQLVLSEKTFENDMDDILLFQSIMMILFCLFFILWQLTFNIKLKTSNYKLRSLFAIFAGVSLLLNQFIPVPIFFAGLLFLTFQDSTNVHLQLSKFYSVLVLMITIMSLLYNRNDILSSL